MSLAAPKYTKIQQALIPAYMSTDEECTEGFITHQPSWQSAKFKEYKGKLDVKYSEICSTKIKRLMQKRVIGDVSANNLPELSEELNWIADV